MKRRNSLRLIACIGLCLSLAYPATLSAEDVPTKPLSPELKAEQKAEEKVEEEKPLYITDSPAYRKQAVMTMLCDLFAVKDAPEPGDEPMDLLPKGTQALPVVNPGFEFTHTDGKAPGRDWWFVGFRAGDEHPIFGGGQGKKTDAIEGWNGTSCAGLESGRPFQWITAPDGCTGYIVAHSEHTLYQTLEEQLKPNTRYTLIVEIYKRKGYKRCEANNLIIKLEADEDSELKTDTADYVLNAADLTTGFALSAITFTTTADQAPGNLTIRLGMDTTGSIRVNFDNIRLWAQPLD
ncbi:MAG: hypothetical protein AB8C95_11380 [Phycisphaeraceae bacterium]